MDELMKLAKFRVVSTQAESKQAHLNAPDLGSRLANDDLQRLAPEGNQVQIVVSDGLGADAVHDNVPRLLPVLVDALETRKIRVGQPLLVRYGRVKLAEPIAARWEPSWSSICSASGPAAMPRPRAACRPIWSTASRGASTAGPASGSSSRPLFEYTVISNIHDGGLPPLEAGSLIAEKIFQILTFRAAGNRLESLLERAGLSG